MLSDEQLNIMISAIPDYTTFLTVDEMDESSKKLVEQYPDRVEVRNIGNSREGNPIYCLKIGKGKKAALAYGCPHPNEPIGAMLIEFFSRYLVENDQIVEDMDYTWYLIKSIDVDGTRLNEGWFRGPFTLQNYARNFFRPAGHKQVDWTFPIEYKKLNFQSPIPETQALMKLIEEIKPQFNYSLHNAGFGGVYWYLTEPLPELYDKLRDIAARHKVPLNLGEPESPYLITYSEAIHRKSDTRQSYDYYEKHGVKDPSKIINTGTCSAQFVQEVCNGFTMLTELPYFYDKRITDLSETDYIRKDTVLDKLNFNEDMDLKIKEILKPSIEYMSNDNPFKLALESFTKSEEINSATRKMIETNQEYQVKATVSEWFSNILVAKVYKLLSIGMLIRAHEFELSKPHIHTEEKIEKFQNGRQEAQEIFTSLSKYLEKEIDYSVVPIKNLIAIQLESGMIVSRYLQKRN